MNPKCIPGGVTGLAALSLLAAGPLAGLTAAQDGGSEAEPRQEQRRWKAELGQPAPDFELEDLEGEGWKLSEQRGKVVVLEWFNPDCPIVKRAHGEGGTLDTLGGEARGRGVVWVAINSGAPGQQGTGAERNEAARQEWNLDYPILLDEAGWVGRMYGATTTPHMFVVDAKGMLVYAGGHDDGEGTSFVQQALADLAAGREVAAPSTKNYGCNVKYARGAKLGLVAPDFELTSFGGESVRLSDLRGKPVVLEWFNPQCPVVKKAHGAGGSLESSAARMTQKGVAWLAINSGAEGQQGSAAETNLEAKARWKLAHPILADPTGKTGKAFGATVTPHMFVIDERGVLVYAGAPAPEEGGANHVEEALRALAAGKPVPVAETRAYGCNVKYAD